MLILNLSSAVRLNSERSKGELMRGQTLFFVVVSAWVAVDAFIIFAFHTRYKQPAVERFSKYILAVSIATGMLLGPLTSETPKGAWLEPIVLHGFMGIPMILTGVFLRLIAVRQLGKAFSTDIPARQDLGLRTEGLYRLVRHPAYTGELLCFLRVSLAYSHLYSSIIAVVIPITGLLYRVRIEEQMLLRCFGREYAKYKENTKMLIQQVF